MQVDFKEHKISQELQTINFLCIPLRKKCKKKLNNKKTCKYKMSYL